MDMIVLGSAGLAGSRRIWQQEDCRRELLQRYPARFFRSLGEAGPEAGAEAAEEMGSQQIRSFLEAQGIPEEDLPKLFSRFFRASASLCKRPQPLH